MNGKLAHLRILIISHMFPSIARPNSGRFIYNHIRALVEAGASVRVLQPVPWAPPVLGNRPRWREYRRIAMERDYEGISVKRFRYPQPPAGVMNALGSLMLVPALGHALKRERRSFVYDLIHAHTLTPDGFASVVTGRRYGNGKPIFVSARGSDVHTYPYRSKPALATARFAINRCDHLVCVSEALASEARALVGRDVNASVIYNGVDTELFSPAADKEPVRHRLRLPPGGTLILFVGAIVEEKGVIELIEAIKTVGGGRKDLRLLVVGGGPLETELEVLNSSLGGQDRVILAGAVSGDQVADYMRASDVLVHPSHAEGLPNVVLEAMASGLPVVASSVGGIPEVVRHGQTGWLVMPGAPAALAEALGSLTENQVWARELGRAGREYVLQTHSWDRNAKEHVDLYRDFLACSPRKSRQTESGA